ncbi:aminotransferase class IV [Curtobacterium sp. MCLR17_044]|uniref:aminotransferase class IV n=1 Tax=Curtobacterium sp. MCLR17_044 TaxID=2175628 RepID=UPI000DAA52AE|nr:aminotransferase class IV [Curtobacterium sp. MCLR17_044]PZE56166.1 hypothetical protein DEJ04_13150 [Curtobacterium sp. MCLR17_044]
MHADDEHLHRFAHSASILELPAPALPAFRAAVKTGIAALDDASDAYCKYVPTRGRESGPVGRPGEPAGPTGYAYLDPNPSWERERTTGISVVLLSRGYELTAQTGAPWLFQGAKTLSYAVNRAVLREAARRGANDVQFTTTDGYVPEGLTLSLVAKFEETVVTPAQSGGALHGTAQIGAFAFFEGGGVPDGVPARTGVRAR